MATQAFAQTLASDTLAIAPPEPLNGPTIVYPMDGQGAQVDLELMLTIDVEGFVSDAEIIEPVNAPEHSSFRAAALTAARTLKFKPAQQGGAPIPSRIRYRMLIAPLPTPAEAHDVSVVERAVPREKQPVASEVKRVEHRASGKNDVLRELTVRTKRRPVLRAASDFELPVGLLSNVPLRSASDLLRLAPGIFLTNESGDGHADSILLRGFDAHEGSDLELTVQGIPINEPGHPHGEGLANLNFIIPELVRSLRVVEGPFDPRQGNYAVAGSAAYDLGLEERGAQVKYQLGSFGTQRLVALYRPTQASANTFAGADVRSTDGFGQNRAAKHGRMMSQVEFDLGAARRLRIFGSTYATTYEAAGVVREDDVQAGRIGFYDTYDRQQGGDVRRQDVSLNYEDNAQDLVVKQQLFATLRDSDIRANPTGFVDDPPDDQHAAQRGDLLDQHYRAVSVGGRGSVRMQQVWAEHPQALELGYYTRYDQARSSQKRLLAGSDTPYRSDGDFDYSIANIALYADTELKPTGWMTLRGGLRGDFFNYNVLDRTTSERGLASGFVMQPRGTLLLNPWTIDRKSDLTLVGSVGRGARSVDPSGLLGQSSNAFSSIFATEGGLNFQRRMRLGVLNARALYYYTYVKQDLIYDAEEGRNVLSPATRRQGVTGMVRLTGTGFDWSSSATYAHARFDRNASDPNQPGVESSFSDITGDRVPYVPAWVLRSDAAIFRRLPWHLSKPGDLFGQAALGMSYTSPRVLANDAQSQSIFLMDASLGVRWQMLEVGLSVQNLFDNRYRLAQFNYISQFDPNAATSANPMGHFAAGMPRMYLLSVTVHTEREPTVAAP